ncbi:hypothetical protein [Sphingomonas japonica]|uniref:Small lipoprotein YifL n=1 Tax=Sphingomonas japonica TaxID=511662 RepID=A0ABX0U1H0_9SPHN|nr:hypothetical protein [Sphingomonas japonica]NIJ24398.1 putative small lipoprotein YifL [Sphingomonas japonica]
MIRSLAIPACLALAACGGTAPEEPPVPEPTAQPDSAQPQSTTQQGTSPIIENQAALDFVPPMANDAAPAPAPSAEPDRVNADGSLAAIPAAWRGRWAGQGGSCADSSDRRLDIEADRLTFYESVAVPQRIERVSERELQLDLSFTGEGQTWQRRTMLVIGDDGRTMRRSEKDTPLITYTKCPDGSGA